MNPRETAHQPSGTHLSRRNIVTAGAWSVPILVSAISSPLASASREPRVDPTVTRVSSGGSTTQPYDQSPLRYEATGTSANSAIYQDNSAYNTRIYVRNNGPETMPAGSTLTISIVVYPASGAYIDISAFQSGTAALGINSSTMTGGALTFSGPSGSSGGSMNRVFTINRPIPSGSEFMIQIAFNIADISAERQQGGLSARITAPTGTVDTNTGNNVRISAGDVYYVR